MPKQLTIRGISSDKLAIYLTAITAHQQLLHLEDVLREVKQNIGNKIYDHKANRDSSLAKLLGLHDRWSVSVGHWECSESPLDVCVYNNDKDLAHDNCLYCGDPEERK